MTDPHAVYRDSKLWWRGSNPGFRYMPLDEALSLRDVFEAETEDHGVPGYAARCKAYAADLTAAIEEMEANDGS